MTMWSLRFALWPPSLLGCGGRLNSKQLQLHSKNHMWSISCPLYKGNDIYIYTYICHICHICIELWNKFPKIWCTKFRKQNEKKTIFRRLSRLQACFQIQLARMCNFCSTPLPQWIQAQIFNPTFSQVRDCSRTYSKSFLHGLVAIGVYSHQRR